MQIGQMDRIRELLRAGQFEAAASMMPSQGTSSSFDWAEHARRTDARSNGEAGVLAGYDCPDCMNRGYTLYTDELGHGFMRPCNCREVRQALENIAYSGLDTVLDTLTFEVYRDGEPWQKALKGTSLRYLAAIQDGGTPWLYFSGQPGCGKTHLCTAICGELLRSGRAVRYMVWPGTVERIKGLRYDDEAMQEHLEPLKQADVLYIDDLLKASFREKVDRGGNRYAPRPEPSEADMRLCHEIINARYIQDKPTILSGEWSLLRELMDVDEATFSRVYQKAKPYICEVGRDARKNYRIRRDGQEDGS